MEPLFITPSLTIPEEELLVAAVRSSGPGGQNVNKVSTKIELRFAAGTSAVLHPEVRARLLALAGSRATLAGEVVVSVDETRSQKQNLLVARQRLAELVRAALVRPKKRRPTRPTRGSVERRLGEKKRRSETKRGRSGGGGGD